MHMSAHARTCAALLWCLLLSGCCFLGIGDCGDICQKTPTAPTCDPPSSGPPTPPSVAQRLILPIPGVLQQTPVWCWASVSEMVLRHYGYPNLNPASNYQCGIVGVAGAVGLLPPICNLDCGNPQCIVPIGDASRLIGVILRYREVVVQFGGVPPRPIAPRWNAGTLSLSGIQASLNRGAPVIVGITPSGIPTSFAPAHVALIVGFDSSAFNGRGIIVNDPFPYGLGTLGPYGDPYVLAGALIVGHAQYLIDYSSFAQRLAWTETILLD